MAAGAFSDFLEGTVLQWLTGRSAMPSLPANLYVGLFTTIPADTGTYTSPSDGTEVASASAYARVAVATPAGVSTVIASGTTQQFQVSAAVTFPQATGSWGTVVGYGVWDSPSQIANPAGAPSLSASGTGSGLTAGTYTAAYTWLTHGGETMVSPTQTQVVTAGQDVVFGAVTPPTGATGVNYYISIAAGNATMGFAGTNATGAAFTATANGGAAVPAANTSAGHLLWYDSLTASQAISSNQTPSLAASQVVLSLD